MNFTKEELIEMPRPASKYPKSTMQQRAAQFMPFSALKGYDECIALALKNTIEKIDLSEEQQAEINETLCKIRKGDQITLEYFVKDPYKSGGEYKTVCQKFKRMDLYSRKIYLENNGVIRMDDIYSVTIE